MSRFHIILALGAATACLGTLPCRAQSSLPVANPTTTATTRPYIVPVKMQPQQMATLAKIMRSKDNYCYLQDLQPEDDSSMLLICGSTPPTAVSFSP